MEKILLILLVSVLAVYGDDEQVRNRFGAEGLVPSIIPEAPVNKLGVVFPSGGANGTVDLGKQISPSNMHQQPQLTYEHQPDKYYTITFFDPDAPSRQAPVVADVKHWLVVNVPGAEVARGEVLGRYAGPAPPPGSGLHRYTFLVYEQSAKLDFSSEPKSPPTQITHWSLKKFVAKYQLGRPHAGNFLNARAEA